MAAIRYKDVWVVEGARGINAPIKTKRVAGKSWPDYDIDGRKMFVNTHFATEGEAWAKLLAEVRAGQSLDAGRYRSAQTNLARATTDLAESAAHVVDVERAFEEWQSDATTRGEAGR